MFTRDRGESYNIHFETTLDESLAFKYGRCIIFKLFPKTLSTQKTVFAPTRKKKIYYIPV